LNDTAAPLKHDDIDIEVEPNNDKEIDPCMEFKKDKVTAPAKVNRGKVHKYEQKDIHTDVNGNHHKAAWAEEKKDNCLIGISKRFFTKWFPYYSVLPHTDEAK